MNKTALVTGASVRIGRAITEHLAENGWNIIVHYNSSGKAADDLCRALFKKYPNQKFTPVQANFENVDEVEALIPKVVSEEEVFGLLINNASVFDSGYIGSTSLNLYENQMNVNLRAPFILTKAFAGSCKSGNIINFTDTRITSNKTNFAAYSLSKKGLWDLTKMAALEFGPEIRVNAIAPGLNLAPEDKDEDFLYRRAKKIPMKKPGGVEPVLRCIDFILKNNYLTGQLLFADGGENLGENE